MVAGLCDKNKENELCPKEFMCLATENCLFCSVGTSGGWFVSQGKKLNYVRRCLCALQLETGRDYVIVLISLLCGG